MRRPRHGPCLEVQLSQVDARTNRNNGQGRDADGERRGWSLPMDFATSRFFRLHDGGVEPGVLGVAAAGVRTERLSPPRRRSDEQGITGGRGDTARFSPLPIGT